MQYGKICIMSVLVAGLAACTTPSNNQAGMQQPPLVRSAYADSPRGGAVVRQTYAQNSALRESDMVNAPVGNNAQQTVPMSNTVTTTAAPNTPMVAQAPARVSSTGSGLSTNLNYSQTWERVGKALPAAGYPVMEQDGSSGTYYVLDKSSTGGTIKRDTPIYQVRVQRQGNGSSINVLNAQNQPADSGVSSRILGALRNQIS